MFTEDMSQSPFERRHAMTCSHRETTIAITSGYLRETNFHTDPNECTFSEEDKRQSNSTYDCVDNQATDIVSTKSSNGSHTLHKREATDDYFHNTTMSDLEHTEMTTMNNSEQHNEALTDDKRTILFAQSIAKSHILLNMLQSRMVKKVIVPALRRTMSLMKVIILPIEKHLPTNTPPTPLFPHTTSILIQHAPRQNFVHILFYLTWFAAFCTLVHFNSYAAQTDVGKPQNVHCYASFWRLPGTLCGVNGVGCLPFSDKTSYIRCFGDCDLMWIPSDLYVGFTKIPRGSSYVLGDPSGYRADSWVCPAAIQSGVIHKRWGGCLAVDFIGEAQEYHGTNANGIQSFGYNSWFPKTFRTRKVDVKYCFDYSWIVLPFNIFMAWISTLLLPSKRTFWLTMTLLGYYHTIFFSDPADRSDSFLSQSFANLFIILAISYCFFQAGGKRVLPDANCPIDRFVLFVLPLFFGILINKWSKPLPQITLTADSLRDKSKMTTMIVGSAVLFLPMVYQLVHIRRLRLLPWYLLGYLAFVAGYSILPYLLVLRVHCHHWLVAVILFPLTTVRLRISVVYQAALLGVFLNGVARWGLASPLETYTSDLSYGIFGSPQASWTFNATQFRIDYILHWRFIPEGDLDVSWVPHTRDGHLLLTGGVGDIDIIKPGMWVHGYSVLVNDVEVYRGPKASLNLSLVLNRTDNNDRPFYVQVALTSEDRTLDYSAPLIVYRDGKVLWADGSVYDGYRPLPSARRSTRWHYRHADSDRFSDQDED